MTKPLVVITGASSGFGAATAKLFNEDGYPLLLLARRTEKIKELDLNFDNVMIEKVDVTDKEQFEKAVRKAEDVYGKTDLLVNNAGVMLLGNVKRQDPSEWQTMLDTNVMGVLNGTQIVLSDMTDREHGTIINISSMAGKQAFANHAAYVASKFGVHGLSETIRMENASSNVRVSIVAPGAAETELLDHVTDKQALSEYKDWKKTIGGITLDPNNVAKSIKFIYDMPQEVNINELDIIPTLQS